MSQAAGILFPLIRRVLIEGRISDYGNLAQMLVQAGTELSHVTHLQTGADVLRAALHSDLPPDRVLSASQLPDMGAMHLLMALCGTDGMPVFPVVVVSPDDTRDEAERVLQAGGHGYVCVEGLTARSLVQELENTAIGWQLVRQLRDRQTRARRVTNHEAFQLGLTDAIHPQTDPHAIKAMAATRLGQYLQASRVTSAEKLEDDQVLVERGYVDRVAQIDGIYPLRELGGSKQSDLEAGRKIVCSELKSDSRYPDAEKANFAAIGIVANLKVPLLKNGELVATFGVHQSEPRQWTDREMAALRGVAERTRVAAEFARSESRRRAGQTRLAQMVETMPSFCVVLRGPNHIYEQANQRLYDTLGHGPEILGKPVLQALAEIASQPFPALLDVVYRTGQPFVEN
ncbi:MAG: GAF domain-containing protein, partial [Polaromonas sp.]|nr:GAF domain-containing protein [Polaromonas sp.]